MRPILTHKLEAVAPLVADPPPDINSTTDTGKQPIVFFSLGPCP